MTDQNSNAWWEEPLKVFGEVTGYIVVPLVAALYGGRALDHHFESEPLIMIGLLLVAVIISTLAIVRIAVRYMKQIEEEAKKK
ncbi:MAG: AtpZ/AtpI family protein [Patescibacteria group bacterium]|jgi:F0F1-type ATP synthase assembly protein I